MSTPAEEVNAATDSSDSGQAGSGDDNLSFDERVNQTVNSLDKDANGNLILPEDIPEDLKYAVRAEKRRRDTQSALAKTTSSLSVLQVENEELKKLAQQAKTITVSPEEQEELDELKHSDPDAWRQRMNELEQRAAEQVETQLSEISTTAKTKGTVGERKILLEAFLEDNPGLVINDEVLKNDIPPRITRALEDGEVSFMEFLGNVKEYLESGKVIADNKPKDPGPNLSKIGGNDVPGERAEGKQSETDYEDMIF